VRTRRILGVLTTIGAIVNGLVWLATIVFRQLPFGWWPAVVFPFWPVMFVAWFVTIMSINQRSPRELARIKFPIPLRGWRLPVGIAGFVAVWLVAMMTFSSGDSSGQPERIDGRYYSNSHGDLTEITRDQWERLQSASARLFSGGTLVFCGLAALYLTQSEAENDVVLRR
jgi:hypothetical protein